MRSPGMVAYALGCMVLGSGIGGWLIFKERAVDQAEVQRRVIERDELDRQLKDAVALIRSGDWKAAHPVLLEIRQRNAQFGAARVEQLLKATAKEVLNQQHLEACRAAIGTGDLRLAAEELGGVSRDTAQVLAREELQREVVRVANARAEEASALASFTSDRAKMAELLSRSDEILFAVPNQRHALTLKSWAEAALEKLARRDRVAASKTPWLDAQEFFRSGDILMALSLAELCAPLHAKCKALRPLLQRFNDEFEDGADEARLLRIERQILGPAGGYWRAEVLVEQARTAMLKGDYKRALGGAQKALEISPGHADAEMLVDELHELAEELYHLDSEGPVADEILRMRKVVALTEPDDAYHQLASQRLEALKR